MTRWTVFDNFLYLSERLSLNGDPILIWSDHCIIKKFNVNQFQKKKIRVFLFLIFFRERPGWIYSNKNAWVGAVANDNHQLPPLRGCKSCRVPMSYSAVALPLKKNSKQFFGECTKRDCGALAIYSIQKVQFYSPPPLLHKKPNRENKNVAPG